MKKNVVWLVAYALLLITILAACTHPPSSVPSVPPKLSSTALPSNNPLPTVTPASTAIVVSSFYVHPEILAEAGWLHQHLDDTSIRIVDARNPFTPTLYKTGHIPGAIYVDVFSQVCCPSKIMGAKAFENLMGTLGIGDDITVVIYDTDGGLWSARLWWALRYYGHDKAKILNGGLNQWVYNGYALDTETPAPQPAVFHANIQPRWIAAIDEVRSAIDDPDVAIVDALPWSSYTGDSNFYSRPGHIASAVNFPQSNAINALTQQLLPASDLAKMLMRLKLDPAQRTITYCGGGHAGSHLAFILYLMGFENVALYDGSLQEWSSDALNPMEIVP